MNILAESIIVYHSIAEKQADEFWNNFLANHYGAIFLTIGLFIVTFTIRNLWKMK